MNELNTAPMFFLGANSPLGFVSSFGESFNPEDGWRAYIIKGGPGTGKSTLMKRVAIHFIKQGLRCELCPCSSDPSSLDGVIFPDIRAVLLDGTAPHVVEPRLCGVSENIINLGAFWDSARLYEKREQITALYRENSRFHKQATGYIKAAGALFADTARVAADCTDTAKLQAFAHRTAKKLIPKTAAKPKQWVRYLSAVTPNGHVFYRKTPQKLCETVVVIGDEYGAAAPVFMETVRRHALDCGHEIICCRCPMNPINKCEHIIIPALSLAFCTTNRYHKIEAEGRTLHARRFSDIAALRQSRARLTFNRRAAAELVNAAVGALENAKTVHDELEKQYAAAMDYTAQKSICDELIKKLSQI